MRTVCSRRARLGGEGVTDNDLYIERGKDFSVSPACDGVKLTHHATGSVLVIPSGMEATIPLTGIWTVGDGPPREKPVRASLTSQLNPSVSMTRLPLAAVEQLAVQGEVPAHWLAGAREAHARRAGRMQR